GHCAYQSRRKYRGHHVSAPWQKTDGRLPAGPHRLRRSGAATSGRTPGSIATDIELRKPEYRKLGLVVCPCAGVLRTRSVEKALSIFRSSAEFCQGAERLAAHDADQHWRWRHLN